jgi:predicted transposase/invertase (TIGR01784 family)
MIQIELPRSQLDKKTPKEFDLKDWWVELLRNSSGYTDEKMEELRRQGVGIPSFFQKGLGKLDMDIWVPKMQREYQESLTDRIAYATVLAVERQEGKKEGEREKQFQIARNLIKKGASAEMIAEVTGLSLEEIQSLI